MSYLDFVHLHNHSEYSMLDSTAKIKDLVAKAKSFGMKALAITDHGKMYGTLKFYNECKKNGIKPIIGCEVYTTNHLDSKIKEQFHLILLAKNNIGYHNLVRLVSEATQHVYYKPLVDKNLLRKYSDGLICLSACIGGEIPRAILNNDIPAAKKAVEEFIDIYGKDDFYIEIQNHGIKEEATAGTELINLANAYALKLVATNDIHYIEKEDWEAQDTLLCLQTGSFIDDVKRMRFPQHEFYFKSQKEMYDLLHDYHHCLSNTKEIADKCNVEIEYGQKLAPSFPKVPDGFTEETYLRYLCEQSLPKLYPDMKKQIVAKKRLEYELNVINKMKYPGYFLIVWDFINYARSQKIMVGPGRGSAAGSIVAYLMGITELDPLAYDLLFERFLNPERVSMPDIDTDISDSNKVADYMMHTYHLDKSAKIVAFQTEASRGVIRDIVKVNKLPYAFGDKIAKLISTKAKTIKEAISLNAELQEMYDNNTEIKKLLDMGSKLQGLPRQIGTHAAGVVISQYALKDILPVDSLADGLHTCFDKDEVEKLGLLKMDLLGLKNLYIIEDAEKLITDKYHIVIDFKNIPLDDKKTMEMLQKGDTFGVFQLESDGITDLVKKLEPHEYKDLIPLVALYRPGPLGSGMVEDFIECRHGRKEITYMHPLLEPILKETFGVILYQEQVMKIVQVLAGFSLGKADVMRRAMGHKEPELLQKQKVDFVNGCQKNNIDGALAEKIFDLMMHFASYGFNKSHSAAYAYLAYQTAYLKANYPLEYISAYVSNNLDNEKKVYASINTCKKHNINILPPNVLSSNFIFTPEDAHSIRFGLGAIKSLGASTVNMLIEERNKKMFTSIGDFLNRVDISKQNFINLCNLNAFTDLYKEQEILSYFADKIYTAVKDFKKKMKKNEQNLDSVNLFSDSVLSITEQRPPELNDIIPEGFLLPHKESLSDKLNTEKELLGFYATNQPLDYCKNTLVKCNNVADILANPNKYMHMHIFNKQTKKFIESQVSVCGLKESLRIINTKENKEKNKESKEMAFMTLSIYDKKIDCILFPTAYQYFVENGGLNNSIILFRHASVQLRNDKVQLIISNNKDDIKTKNL